MISFSIRRERANVLKKVLHKNLYFIIFFIIVLIFLHYNAFEYKRKSIYDTTEMTADTLQKILPRVTVNDKQTILFGTVMDHPFYSYIAVLDCTGLIIFHSEQDRVGIIIMDEAIKKVLNKKTKSFNWRYRDPDNSFSPYYNQKVYELISPYYERGELIGVLVIGVRSEYIYETQTELITLEVFMICIFSLILLLFGIKDYIYEISLIKTNARSVSTVFKILELFSIISEIKDPYTAGHQKRVAALAYRVAKKLNLSDVTCESCYISGLLHDIGKLFIPSEILNKNESLTEVEYNIIKKHPENGYTIIKNFPLGENVAETILQHHELINGSGYPYKLKDTEILITSKIVAVCDAIEAMSFDRPYRLGLHVHEIIKELLKCKGKTFDDTIITTVIDILNEKTFSWDELENEEIEIKNVFI